MNVNRILKISMVQNNDKFQKVFNRAYNKTYQPDKNGDILFIKEIDNHRQVY